MVFNKEGITFADIVATVKNYEFMAEDVGPGETREHLLEQAEFFRGIAAAFDEGTERKIANERFSGRS